MPSSNGLFRSIVNDFAVLSLRQIWSWRLAVFAIANYAAAFTIVDVLPVSVEDKSWAIFIEIVCIGMMLVFGLASRKIAFIFPGKKPSQRTAINVFLFVLSVFLTNAIGSPLLHASQPINLDYWIKDVTIGIFGGFYIGLMYVALFGMRITQANALSNLENTRDILNRSIDNASSDIEFQRESIFKRTKLILEPAITEIYRLLEIGKCSSELVDRIRLVISKDVASLVGESKRIQNFKKSQTEIAADVKTARPRVTLKLSQDIKPFAIWLSYLPGLTLLIKLDAPELLFTFGPATSLILLGLLLLAKHFLFKDLHVSLSAAVAVLVLVCLSYTAIIWLLLPIWVNPDYFGVVIVAVAYGSIVLTLTFTVVSARNRSSEVALEELQELNKKLQVAELVLNRNLWVMNMKWYSMLHGQVQSTLTSAILTLDSKVRSKQEVRDEVVGYLESISQTIETMNFNSVDFKRATSETVQAWRGVCDVELKLDSAAELKIEDDEGLGFVVNEIVKELVSNLYSQLAVAKLEISIRKDSGDYLNLAAIGQVKKSLDLELEKFTKMNLIAPGWKFLLTESSIEIKAELAAI